MKGDNVPPQINFIPYESFGKNEDVRNRVPSIDKIKKLGYNPQWTLDDGLRRTIDWQIERNKKRQP
jgi:nucleoside-diphosphate-sugar epimerase